MSDLDTHGRAFHWPDKMLTIKLETEDGRE